MVTRLIRHPGERDLRYAAELIRAGCLVAFPTETVYGLGGNALRPDAAGRIYQAKGRPSDNPLIIHLASAEAAGDYCETTPLFEKLARAFLPGPLTMILPKKPCIPLEVTGGLDTVAVRVPENALAGSFLAACGVPVAAPSANTSGRPSPTSADHVFADLAEKVEFILDGGACALGVESTIVKLDGERVTLLRPGAVTPEMLRAVAGELAFDDRSMEKPKAGEIPLAPGMKYRHYAPRASLTLLEGSRESILNFLREKGKDKSVAILADGSDMLPLVEEGRVLFLGERSDPASLAKHLFAALRALDERKEITAAYAAMPEKKGMGLAVYNRLLKASGYTVLRV